MNEPTIHLTQGNCAIRTVTDSHVEINVQLPGDAHPIEGYLVSVPLADVLSLVAQLQSAVSQTTRD